MVVPVVHDPPSFRLFPQNFLLIGVTKFKQTHLEEALEENIMECYSD